MRAVLLILRLGPALEKNYNKTARPEKILDQNGPARPEKNSPKTARPGRVTIFNF